MMKSNLRFLGIGFLCSALLLSAFQLVSADEPETDSATLESLVAEKEAYRVKYEKVLAKYNTLQDKEQTSEKTPEKTETVGPVPFTVEEGQPSAVVLENLTKEGFIPNVQEAEKYLNDNGLLTQIRFGTYTLSRDMEMKEVFAILTGIE